MYCFCYVLEWVCGIKIVGKVCIYGVSVNLLMKWVVFNWFGGNLLTKWFVLEIGEVVWLRWFDEDV